MALAPLARCSGSACCVAQDALFGGLLVGGDGVLDQGQHAAGHEPGRPYRGSGTGDLGDLDDAAPVADLDAPPGPGGDHLVGPGLLTRVNDDLDPVTLHLTPPRTYIRGIPTQ